MEARASVFGSRERVIRGVLLAVVMMIPLAYSAPLIGLGLEDINAVRHLDEGEYAILDAWVGVYPQGPFYAGPFKINHIYPKAFYNLAGLFLYPYSALHGEDFRAVLVVWRSLNAVLGAGVVLLLFLLVRQVFGSDLVAVGAAALFAVTPEFLEWVANVRPNPFEQLLIFATLLACVRLCRGFSYGLFLVASLTGALAFATKYGGMPFLLVVPAVALYAAWRGGAGGESFSDVVRGQARVLRWILPAIAVAGALGLAAYVWVFSKYGFDGVSLFTGISAGAFPSERLGRVAARLAGWKAYLDPAAWGILVGLAIVVLLSALAWRAARREYPGGGESCAREKAWLFFAFFLQTAAIYLVTFFFAGPAYLVHPHHFISQVGWMVYYSGFAGSYGGVSPTISQALQLTANELRGWWLFVPLILYALYVEVKHFPAAADERARRLVLWGYIAVSLFVFVVTRVGVLRHILPVIGLLWGFVMYAVARSLPNFSLRSPARLLAAVSFLVLMCGYWGVNAAAAFERWEDHRQKSSDVGFEAGDWLRSRYDPRTRILTDKWTIYVPPEFTSVTSTIQAEGQGATPVEKARSVRELVVALDPDVILLADLKQHAPVVRLAEMLDSDPALRSRGYRLVQRFDSRRRGDKLENIRIYEKTVDAFRG